MYKWHFPHSTTVPSPPPPPPFSVTWYFPALSVQGLRGSTVQMAGGSSKSILHKNSILTHYLVQIVWCHKQLTDQCGGVSFWVGVCVYITIHTHTQTHTRLNTGTWTLCGCIIVDSQMSQKCFFLCVFFCGHLDSQFLFFPVPYCILWLKGPDSISRKDMGPMQNLTVI